jgi:hypothetical protein
MCFIEIVQVYDNNKYSHISSGNKVQLPRTHVLVSKLMKTSTHVAVFWCCLRVKYNNEICYEEGVPTLESTLNCPSSADYHFKLRVALKITNIVLLFTK